MTPAPDAAAVAAAEDVAGPDGLDGYADFGDWTHPVSHSVPGGHLVLPGARLKWYDIRVAGQPESPEVSDGAREFLRAETAAGLLEFRRELGYVLLHRCGAAFHVMQVCVWRDRNELVQAIYARDGGGWQPYEQEAGLQLATQDVVELDVTAHERRAWSVYLRSARDTAAKRAYLDDFDAERDVG
ncbi:hypothetical protein [Streptomyces sp. NPDC047000]|uniref:hypothetical protein n=1 Tax=Streptomyces sp. NPDC047000 TaxID=3155474 RepID=UPI0033D18AD4